MTSFSPSIWKSHRKRLYIDACPHCGKPIIWIHNGIDWYPCDKEPVLFTMHPQGKDIVIYKSEELNHCVIYDPKNSKCTGTPFKGHIQHFYTCPVLIKNRTEWAKKNQNY